MLAVCLAAFTCLPQEAASEKPTTQKAVVHPLTSEERKQIANELNTVIKQTTDAIEKSPANSRAISSRADAFFFAGRFKEALRDYDRLVELEPSLDRSHWRRGIAYFYASDFKKAAAQFERYHSFDNVDRENGIWRYLSQYKAHGQKLARQGLLKYRKDDREPFPDVYKLFAGKMEPKEILSRIGSASISEMEREKRMFYAELYIGLNELVEGRRESARKHLTKSVATKWPRTAGFGPRYMWHVGRLQLELLGKPKTGTKGSKPQKP
ncbi:MAG: tetratricopeptide repeat protein [Planctomycetaceae bacterium]